MPTSARKETIIFNKDLLTLEQERNTKLDFSQQKRITSLLNSSLFAEVRNGFTSKKNAINLENIPFTLKHIEILKEAALLVSGQAYMKRPWLKTRARIETYIYQDQSTNQRRSKWVSKKIPYLKIVFKENGQDIDNSPIIELFAQLCNERNISNPLA